MHDTMTGENYHECIKLSNSFIFHITSHFLFHIYIYIYMYIYVEYKHFVAEVGLITIFYSRLETFSSTEM